MTEEGSPAAVAGSSEAEATEVLLLTIKIVKTVVQAQEVVVVVVASSLTHSELELILIC